MKRAVQTAKELEALLHSKFPEARLRVVATGHGGDIVVQVDTAHYEAVEETCDEVLPPNAAWTCMVIVDEAT